MKSSMRFAVVLGLAMAAASPAMAQTYPSAPVKVLVPFGAGGATDVLARVFSDRLQQRIGQSFTVENRGGAAGQIAADGVRPRAGRRLHPDVHHRGADHHRAADERQGAVRSAQGLRPGRAWSRCSRSGWW